MYTSRLRPTEPPVVYFCLCLYTCIGSREGRQFWPPSPWLSLMLENNWHVNVSQKSLTFYWTIGQQVSIAAPLERVLSAKWAPILAQRVIEPTSRPKRRGKEHRPSTKAEPGKSNRIEPNVLVRGLASWWFARCEAAAKFYEDTFRSTGFAKSQLR